MNRSLLIRSIGWTLALLLLALPVLAIWRGWYTDARWQVRYLSIDASFQHVSAQQIRAQVQPLLGSGYFAINLQHIRAAVARLPWVAEVDVRKHWPASVILRVREYQPWARWNNTRLIGLHGRLFTVPDVSAISGIPRLSGPQDRLADVEAFYRQMGPSCSAVGLKIAALHLAGRGSWSLTTADGSVIRVGATQPIQRLRRFLAVWPKLLVRHPGGRFINVDLRYPNGFAVRWPDLKAGSEPSPVATAASGAHRA